MQLPLCSLLLFVVLMTVKGPKGGPPEVKDKAWLMDRMGNCCLND